ncbi:hypothetical protein MKJ04_01005 [Pontibacter sp. E15-1]|uniref:hypothetical protein n=1 Tax=Pontibacter sp. E15-1 TaxID=2919918 RepID=UPI001F4F23DE|nr:hypothetical protein [Pontibacter sp. E15-1]MCJ8163401.1 hypothetical protein [Pontibacter sp. E15-1]
MKPYPLQWLLGFALLAGCQPSADKQPVAEETTHSSVTSCYQYLQGNDTVSLRLVQTGLLVTGDLTYNLFEKDKNRGTIKGAFAGDTLFADYTFQSEGMESVREVAFLKQNSALAEGYGEIKEIDGKMRFTDKSQLSFEHVQLRIIPCEAVKF